MIRPPEPDACRRRPLLALAVLACWATAATAAAAAATAAEGLGMEQLEAQLRQDNPELRQARQVLLAAQLAVPQADALAGPQLGLLEQANTGGPFDFNRDSGFYAYYSLSQPLPWPGKRRLAAEAAQAQADIAQSQYDALALQRVADLRLACYQLAALEDQRRFMDEDLLRLEQVKELSRARYASNAAAYVEYLNAQVAAGSLENDRYALDRQMEGAREQINGLLGQPVAAPLALRLDGLERSPRLPAQPLPQLIELAGQVNPLLAGAQAQVSVADKGVALAHKAFWPDLQLSAGSYADPSVVQLQTMRMYSLGVAFNLPSWGLRKERAGLDQAQAQLEGARAGQQAQRQQVELGVAAAYHALETALRQLDFSRERLLPQAQMAWRLALSGYGSNGGIAFSDLLTAQSGLRGSELALVQAENAAVQAYVSLVAAIGKDPAAT